MLILCVLAFLILTFLANRYASPPRFYFTQRKTGIKRSLVDLFLFGVALLCLFLAVEGVLREDIACSGSTQDETKPHVLSCFFNPVFPGFPRLVNMQWSVFFLCLVGITGSLIFSGCLITSLVNGFGRHAVLSRSGESNSLCGLRNHIVIIGAHPAASHIIRSCLEEEKQTRAHLSSTSLFNILKYHWNPPYILLMTTEVPEHVRGRLAPLLNKESEQRVIIMKGSRANTGDLYRAGIAQCNRVYILGEDNETKRDDLNMQCVSLLEEILKAEKKPKYTESHRLTCRVLFDSYTSYLYLQRGSVMPLTRVDLEPECFYKNWAERVLCACEPEAIPKGGHVYRPLDGEGLQRDSEKHVHLVVVGLSDMGVTLALEAAHALHFPNFNRQTGEFRTEITLVDCRMEEKARELRQHLPVFFQHTEEYGQSHQNLTDLVFDMILGDIRSDSVRRWLADLTQQQDILLTVAICLDNPEEALSVALSLPEPCYCRDVNILVYQRNSSGMFDLIQKTKGEAEKYRNVHPFGMMEEDVGLMEGRDQRAMIIQYLYDQIFLPEEERGIWCSDLLERCSERRLNAPFVKSVCFLYEGHWELESKVRGYLKGGEGAKRWQALSAWEKFSNRYASSSVWVKWRSLRVPHLKGANKKECWGLRYYSARHVNELARVEQNRWIVEKLLTGYRPLYGERKKEYSSRERREYKELMIHPDLCSYDELGHQSKECNLFLSLYLYLLMKKWD